jgi:hypothetical protein
LKNIMTKRDPFEELELLLPFYVNGTLSAADHKRVDDALATSPELAGSLQAQIMLAHRIKRDGAALLAGGRSQDEQLAQILSKIDALPQVQTADTRAQGPASAQSSFKSLLMFLSPSRWHPAVSLALVIAALAQGALLLGWNNERHAQGMQVAALEKRVNDLEFQLASGPDDPTSIGNIVVQLDETAAWRDVEALLTAQGLNIVAGPNDGTLTLSSPSTGSALDEVIKRLRASPLVVSADKAA